MKLFREITRRQPLLAYKKGPEKKAPQYRPKEQGQNMLISQRLNHNH
jgi:hypothetical protein